VMLHEGFHRRGVAPERLAAVLCSNAARTYGLTTKGTLEVGKDADIAVVDPNLERVVDPAKLQSFADYSPYEGMKLKGWPVLTMVRGRVVMRDGAIDPEAGAAPAGRYLARAIV